MKKIISLLLVVSTLLSFSSFAFAEEYQKGTLVIYENNKDIEYLIDVPAQLEPGKDAGTVSISGFWPSTMRINITTPKTVVLTNTKNTSNSVSLDVDFAGIYAVGNDTEDSSASAEISVAEVENALYGTYTGTIIYKVETTAADGSVLADESANINQSEEEAREAGFTFSYNNDMGTVKIDSFTKGEETEVVVPAYINDKPVTKISANVFKGQSELTKITVPSTINMIEDNAFNGCSNAEIYINSASFEASGIDTFTNVKEIHVLTLTPGLPIDGIVTAIGKDVPVFLGDTLFTSADGKVKQLSDNKYYMCFTEEGTCIDLSLSDIVTKGINSSLGNRNGKGLMIMTADGNVNYPKYVNGALVTEIPNLVYYNDKNLKSIKIPDSVTYIGIYAFGSCSNLKSVNIPNGVTSIKEFTFDRCESLTGDLVIPEGVTSIGDYAFQYCKSLTSITIPSSVKSIGDYALCSCLSATIYVPNSVKKMQQWG